MPLRRRITAHEKKIVAARQKWTCDACHEILSATYEVDHVIPLHLGGMDDIGNCHALCKECHGTKTQREEIDRLNTIVRASRVSSTRPPLICVRCGHIVSPYFVHRCVPPT